MNAWIIEWINEWINEWMIDWMDVKDGSNLGISMSNINFATPQDAGEWMNEWINKSQRQMEFGNLNVKHKHSDSDTHPRCRWVNEWMNEWIMNEWMNE